MSLREQVYSQMNDYNIYRVDVQKESYDHGRKGSRVVVYMSNPHGYPTGNIKSSLSIADDCHIGDIDFVGLLKQMTDNDLKYFAEHGSFR